MEARVSVPSAMVKLENGIYYTEACTNCLCKYDIEKETVVCVAHFIGEPNLYKDLYVNIVKNNDVIYCIPHNADSIGTYNYQNGEIQNINLPEEIQGEMAKFKCAVIHNEVLYMFGYAIPDIWCYFIKDKRFEVIRTENRKMALFVSVTKKDDVLYVVDKKNETLWSLDCLTNRVKKFNISEQNDGYALIMQCMNQFYLFSLKRGEIHVVDLEKKDILQARIEIPLNFEMWPHGTLCVMDKYSFVFSKTNEYLVIIDLESGEVSKNKINISEENILNNNVLGNAIGGDNGEIYMRIEDSNIIAIYKNNYLNFVKLYVYEKNKFDSRSLLLWREDSFFGISEFVNSL